MKFARVNGIHLHYRADVATAGKPTLVFSNSLGTDFRIWDGVAARLAPVANMVFYDSRGHGLSDAPPAPYRIEDHVADLNALLDHLDVTDAFICGLSVGGLIAQGLYQAAAEKVRGLILCDTAAKIGTPDMWAERIDLVERHGIAAMADAVLERWFAPGFRTPDNPDFAGARNMLVRQTVDGYAGTCAAIRDADYRESSRSIAVPTLCIVGREDGATTPQVVRELADIIPGARYEIIEDAGHIPCMEKPDELSALIADFIMANSGEAR